MLFLFHQNIFVMKKIIWLITIIHIPFIIFSQTLTIDAGVDTILCVTAQGIVMNGTIGGNPTALGGTPPYTYKWTTEYYIGPHLFTASAFLNDTTIANPVVIDDAPTSILKFHVTVTDTNGYSGFDSISIDFSRFGVLPLSNDFFVTSGDTTSINIPFGGATPPYTYAWYPNYNISDTTVAEPYVWPNNDTVYYCTIKDALGCPFTFGNSVIVHVYPVNTKKTLKEHFKVYPNPTQDYLVIKLEKGEIQHLKITDISGRVILQQSKVINNQIDISHLTLGTYILTVKDDEENIGSFQIFKR